MVQLDNSNIVSTNILNIVVAQQYRCDCDARHEFETIKKKTNDERTTTCTADVVFSFYYSRAVADACMRVLFYVRTRICSSLFLLCDVAHSANP